MGEQLITDIILLIVIISEKDALTNIIVQNHSYDVCGIFKVDQVKSPKNPHNEGKHYLFTLCNHLNPIVHFWLHHTADCTEKSFCVLAHKSRRVGKRKVGMVTQGCCVHDSYWGCL